MTKALGGLLFVDHPALHMVMKHAGMMMMMMTLMIYDEYFLTLYNHAFKIIGGFVTDITTVPRGRRCVNSRLTLTN